MRKSISLLSHSSNVNKTISERTKKDTSQNLKLKQRKLSKKIAKADNKSNTEGSGSDPSEGRFTNGLKNPI
jgi:hypothetical protein